MKEKRARRWWQKKRWWAGLALLGVLLFVFVFANVVAYRHTYRLLHFAPPAEAILHPEHLGFSGVVHVALNGFPIPKPQSRRSPSELGLTFSTHRVPVDGEVELEAWHVPHPRARAVVLLFHGRMSTKDIMLDFAKALHRAGMASFLVDFRGVGGSNQSYESIGYFEADDVAASLGYVEQHLAAGLPCFLYGQSMGAAAVIRAVAVHDIAPNGIVLHGVFDTMESATVQQFRKFGVPRWPAVPVMLFWGSRQLGMPAKRHNPVDYARDVRCPALVLHGTRDQEAGIAGARRVFENLAGEKEMIAFPGLGHVGLLHEMPALWEDSVLGFLQRHGAT